MYIGHGNGSRAWIYGKQHRSLEHYNWLTELFEEGYTLDQIVKISNKKLTKQEALIIELDKINKERPEHNKNFKNAGCKFSEEDVKLMQILRKRGFSYPQIAKELNCAAMTVHRALSNKTKGYNIKNV